MKTMRNMAVGGLMALGVVASITPAQAEECLMGEVRMFAGNFAPRNHALAQGQLVAINQNQALFSILGTTYGGDGLTTFALPDLRGRVPVGAGRGPGLDEIQLGVKSGAEFTQPRQGAAAAGNGAAVASPAPIYNLPPFTGVNYIICIQGEYPSRS